MMAESLMNLVIAGNGFLYEGKISKLKAEQMIDMLERQKDVDVKSAPAADAPIKSKN